MPQPLKASYIYRGKTYLAGATEYPPEVATKDQQAEPEVVTSPAGETQPTGNITLPEDTGGNIPEGTPGSTPQDAVIGTQTGSKPKAPPTTESKPGNLSGGNAK